MGGIQGLLTRKLGGLPAWAWGLIGGGLIVGYVWLSRRGSDAAAPAPAAPTTDDTAAADAGDIAGVPTVTPQVTLTTNPAWVRYVEDAAVAAGDDPVLVHNAITKVLAGLEVSDREEAMWATLVSRYGSPPEGAPPIVKATTPTPDTPTPTDPNRPHIVLPRGWPMTRTRPTTGAHGPMYSPPLPKPPPIPPQRT